MVTCESTRRMSRTLNEVQPSSNMADVLRWQKHTDLVECFGLLTLTHGADIDLLNNARFAIHCNSDKRKPKRIIIRKPTHTPSPTHTGDNA
eukprot:897886-Pyramimonas_sp.AAC.3